MTILWSQKVKKKKRQQSIFFFFDQRCDKVDEAATCIVASYHITVVVQAPAAHFWSSLLLMEWKGRGWWFNNLGPCHPCGKLRRSFHLLASVWPSLGSCGHMRSMNSRWKISLSGALPLKEIKQNTNHYTSLPEQAISDSLVVYSIQDQVA